MKLFAKKKKTNKELNEEVLWLHLGIRFSVETNVEPPSLQYDKNSIPKQYYDAKISIIFLINP